VKNKSFASSIVVKYYEIDLFVTHCLASVVCSGFSEADLRKRFKTTGTEDTPVSTSTTPVSTSTVTVSTSTITEY